MANTCSSSSNGVNWWFECSALDDDLIYVGGTAKFTITMKTDPAGSSIPEKKVWLDSLDGDLSFSPQTPSFDHDGASAEITVTGVKPSSAEGTTYIQLRIQSADGPICEVLPMTVFEGVIIKFSGTFYSPIDNQQPGGSWGIGPAPCEWGPPKNIAPTNLVYFQEPPSKRPWTPSVSVAITSVMAKKPAISLDGDPLMSQPVDLDILSPLLRESRTARISPTFGRKLMPWCNQRVIHATKTLVTDLRQTPTSAPQPFFTSEGCG
ncbi:MAG: hypothetical protein HY301_10330 [Verrucomicrobia bacterium]|nr:hypothetical protein [Verrucomicrobiota bacterium]